MITKGEIDPRPNKTKTVNCWKLNSSLLQSSFFFNSLNKTSWASIPCQALPQRTENTLSRALTTKDKVSCKGTRGKHTSKLRDRFEHVALCWSQVKEHRPCTTVSLCFSDRCVNSFYFQCKREWRCRLAILFFLINLLNFQDYWSQKSIGSFEAEGLRQLNTGSAQIFRFSVSSACDAESKLGWQEATSTGYVSNFELTWFQ